MGVLATFGRRDGAAVEVRQVAQRHAERGKAPNERFQRIGAGTVVRLGPFGSSTDLFPCGAVWWRARPDPLEP